MTKEARAIYQSVYSRSLAGRVAQRKYRQTHPEKVRVRNRKYVKIHPEMRRKYIAPRLALLAALKSKPCTDCGQCFPSCAMDFDHVRETKLFGISLGMVSRTMEAVLAELAKCDLVCANCHRIRTWITRRTSDNICK
jgi:5-methylcytosine-specific restriction endonuclease McrA